MFHAQTVHAHVTTLYNSDALTNHRLALTTRGYWQIEDFGDNLRQNLYNLFLAEPLNACNRQFLKYPISL